MSELRSRPERIRPGFAPARVFRRPPAAVVVVGLLGLWPSAVPAGAEPTEPAFRIISARVDPIVIRLGVETALLQVGYPAGYGVESIALQTPANALTRDGTPVDALVLRDDGQGGDGFPGDGIFTVGGIGIGDPDGLVGAVEMRLGTPVELQYLDGTTESFEQDLGLAFRYVDASVPDVVRTQYASDVAASPRVVSMIPPRLVGPFPRQMFLPSEVAQRYYDFFPDDRDFLIMEYGFSNYLANGQFVTIRNDVSGIFDPDVLGYDLYDLSAEYGSNSVLQGVMTTWRGTAATFGLLNHEFLHRWAHFLGMGFSSPGGHGGLVQRPSGGFGGGFQVLEEISPNTFRSIRLQPGDLHWNDLELYLAGLIGPDEVDWPIRLVTNPVEMGLEICPPELAPCSIRIWGGDELREVTLEDFVADFGPRDPGAAVANKNFRSGLIVLYYRLLTSTELAFYEFALQEYEKRDAAALEGLTFHEVTGGLATLSTTLFCDDPDGDGVCAEVDICPTLPNPDQDPEVCDQRIVDIAVDLSSPEGRGSGIVRWRTTHEVSLTGFNLVRIDPAGHRTLLNAEPIPCASCNTGEGNEYSMVVPQHRGGRHIFVEGVCPDGCVGPWGPAGMFEPPGR